MKRSIGSCIGRVVAAWLSISSTAAAQEIDADHYALQREFGIASDLVVEPRWQSLPEDAVARLDHIAAGLGGARHFVNIGEEWAPDDHFRVDQSRAQHLFSAYSDSVSVSIFVLGGVELKVYAVLARRHAQDYCIFELPEPGLFGLRVSIVQHELRPDRDQTVSRIPRCQSRSLPAPATLGSRG